MTEPQRELTTTQYFQALADLCRLGLKVESCRHARAGFAGTHVYDIIILFGDRRYHTDGGLVGNEALDSITVPRLWLDAEPHADGEEREPGAVVAALQALADRVGHPVRVLSATPLQPLPTPDATHDVVLELHGFHITTEAFVVREGADRLLLPSLFVTGDGKACFADSITFCHQTSPDRPFITVKCDLQLAGNLIRSYQGTCGARLKEYLAVGGAGISTVAFVAPGYKIESVAALLIDPTVPNREEEIRKLARAGVITAATGPGLTTEPLPETARSPLDDLPDDPKCYWIAGRPFCVVTAPGRTSSPCDDRRCTYHGETAPVRPAEAKEE